jgi:hypothetical protein
MRRRILQAAALLVILVFTLWAADDPAISTWKLNVEKSNFGGTRPPMSITFKIEPWEDALKATVDRVEAGGRTIHYEFAAKYDGKDYPVKGTPNADMVSLKRTDANHADAAWKKDGKNASTSQFVISREGKTLTETLKTKNPQGADVTIVFVSDKQ